MTPEQTLTAAAARLREAATATTSGPWSVHQANGFLRVGPIIKPRKGWTPQPGADLPEEAHRTAAYIALMHPGVGLLVADLIDDAADGARTYNDVDERFLAVARQILGDQT